MKKVLVISNGCFSKSDSNGRTLANLFKNIDSENLAQFCTYGTPDFEVCQNYYKVSDGDALKSFVKFKETGSVVQETVSEQSQTTAKKVSKTPLKMLLRELVWFFGRWNGKSLKKWVRDFDPEAIVLFLADNIFTLRLARKISKKYNIPIIAYTTEEYCFKNYNYLTRRFSIFYEIFHWWLKRQYKNLEKYVKVGLFNTLMLKEAYEKAYNYPCECIFSPSTIDFIPNFGVTEKKTVSYLGNLGVGRHKALIRLAEALGKVDPEIMLDIYGKAPNDEILQELKDCKNIDLKGFVPYETVVEVIHKSTLLVHAEQDDAFYSKDLKYAFSTKIADSVCSGTPFFMYARADMAAMQFLTQNGCAFVCTDGDSLVEKLRTALTDEDCRQDVVNKAKITREKFFMGTDGIEKFL